MIRRAKAHANPFFAKRIVRKEPAATPIATGQKGGDSLHKNNAIEAKRKGIPHPRGSELPFAKEAPLT
jgi:hypothetical protein